MAVRMQGPRAAGWYLRADEGRWPDALIREGRQRITGGCAGEGWLFGADARS